MFIEFQHKKSIEIKKMVDNIPLRKAIEKLKVPAVIAFGNPLLDIYACVKNTDLLMKYNLKVDGETELPVEKLKKLLEDLPLELEQCVSPGGSAQNSMRILQWLCDETFKNRYTIYCGGLGNDSQGAILEDLVRSAGVDTRYAVHPTLPTGQCIALTNETSRSLAANIGAAAIYTLDDLKKCNLLLDGIKIIYIEGFFITHSFSVAKQLLKQAKEKNIIVVFNLNGEYIFNDHHIAICEMVLHANIILGNAREMEALAQSLNITYKDVTDIPFLLNRFKRITTNVSDIVNEDWLHHGGVFIMSQGGSAPAIAVWGRSEFAEVQPFKPNAPVIDTTGAGDSLAAGFLAGVLAQWAPNRCLEYGCKVASFIVTRLGVSLPDNVPSDLLE